MRLTIGYTDSAFLLSNVSYTDSISSAPGVACGEMYHNPVNRSAPLYAQPPPYCNTRIVMEPKPKKLQDQVQDTLRLKHYSIRTENTYVDWIRHPILFHYKRHRADIGAAGGEAFLTRLAVEERVAVSTRTQTLSALLFLYCEALCQDLSSIDALRAQQPKRLHGSDSGRGATCCRSDVGYIPADGQTPLWQRPAADGMPPPAR